MHLMKFKIGALCFIENVYVISVLRVHILMNYVGTDII